MPMVLLLLEWPIAFSGDNATCRSRAPGLSTTITEVMIWVYLCTEIRLKDRIRVLSGSRAR